MMYDINKLNSSDFEILSQSLIRSILGNGAITFGKGPDGGREATFEGKANYPSPSNQWGGHWVMQAKYRDVRTSEESKDFNWLQKELYKELKKYDTRKKSVKRPNNLIFFTNIILTPVVASGGRDQANILIQKLETQYKINHIVIISYDDIVSLLNDNRDIAISFSGFILPGDILNKLLQLLDKKDEDCRKTNEYIARYLESEFINNINSKLEHAGKLTSDKINLEKVFIDLYATVDGNSSTKEVPKFISSTIINGNRLLKPSLKRHSRFVLIAGPGYGKSTLTQFLCQIYTAYFLKNIDNNINLLSEVDIFLSDCRSSIKASPTCIRLPFKIILKEYASWIIEKEKKEEDYSILNYLRYLINRKCGNNYFSVKIIEEIIFNISTLFIFDGLDEVPASSNRSEVIIAINNFTDIILRRKDTDSLIIGTSRPQGYTKEFDTSQYNHLIITDLNNEDCYDYIKKLVKNIEDDDDKRKNDLQILSVALKDNIVNRLMKSPLQASIMTILVRSGGEPPRNKFELFTEYYSTIFKREKQKNVSKILNEYTTYIDDIHYKLGFTLQKVSESNSSPSATLSLNNFKKFIKDYLETDIALDKSKVDSISEKIYETATNRLVFIEEVQDGFIGFNIRSIQEFFAANYYINVPDTQISDRIRNIAFSSYWNNTLMFCIGYLFKNKRYSIDHIESVFNELNGSDVHYYDSSLTSLYFKGSWLSLDLLNEAIFRGHPKEENKFSKKIENLLSLPFITSHRDLSKLPDNIKNEWLINYLHEGIQTRDITTSITSCTILCLLSQNNFYINHNDFFKRVEILNIDLGKILLNLSKNSLIENQLGKRIFYKVLKDCNPLEFYKVIRRIPASFLQEVINETSDKKILSEIVFTFFLESVYQRLPDDEEQKIVFAEISKKVSGLKHNTFFGWFMTDFDEMYSFKISEKFSGIITPLFRYNKQTINDLLIIAKYFHIKFIIELIAFYEDPTIDNLLKFTETFELYEPAINVRGRISNLNWLFEKMFKLQIPLNKLNIRIKAGEFGNTNDWRTVESSFINKKSEDPNMTVHLVPISSNRTWDAGSTIEMIESIYGLTKKDFKLYSDELLDMVYWQSHNDYEIVKKTIESNKEYQSVLLQALEKNMAESFSGNFFSYFIVIMACFPNDQILKHYDRIEVLAKKMKLEKEGYFINRSSGLMIDLLKKIIDAYRIMNSSKDSFSLIRLVPILLSNPFNTVSELSEILISIDVNYDINDSEDNLIGLCCILILNLHNNKYYLPIIQDIMKRKPISQKLISVFLSIIERVNLKEDICSLLKLLNDKIKDYDVKTQYIGVIKNYTEGQASKIS